MPVPPQPMITRLGCALTGISFFVLAVTQPDVLHATPEQPAPRAALPAQLRAVLPISGADRAHLRTALVAARRSDWHAAHTTIQRTDIPLARKIIRWLYLTADGNGPDYVETRDFLIHNPHWPLRHTLQSQLERRLPADASPKGVVELFAAYPPRTGIGYVRYAQALQRSERTVAAERMIRTAWTRYKLSGPVERDALADFADVLGPVEHERRLNEMLWQRQWGSATRQLKRVPADLRILGEARIRLARRWAGVDRAIARVAPDLLDHPGLVFDRVRWRRRSGFFDNAYELLIAPTVELEEPSRWWYERRYLARFFINDHQFEKAYPLLTPYQEYARPDRAESSWQAGWVALEFLNQPADALRHFRAMRATVSLPISVARAEYWSAKAAAQLGNVDDALAYRHAAAAYPETFYGQAALRELDRTIELPTPPVPSAEDREQFEQNELVRAIRMLGNVGAEDFVRRFTDHVADTAHSDVELLLLHNLCLELAMPHHAVRVAKRGIRQGRNLPALLFPRPDSISFPPSAINENVPYALALAVANQESAFQLAAESPAGAVGLMQIMPATARGTTRRLNWPYSETRLAADREYNVTIGTSVLASLLARYDGSIPLTLAAYNAGSRRVKDWIGAHGDPRDGGVNVNNWIELIPVRETRNYVQRVWEGYRVYEHLLSGRANVSRSN